jgi:hypothetical protein
MGAYPAPDAVAPEHHTHASRVWACQPVIEGQPIVAAVRIAHAGQFNLDATHAKWSAFTSDQLVITRRPGFDWDARIRMEGSSYAAGNRRVHSRIVTDA